MSIYDTGIYRAVEAAGSVSLLAKALGVTRQGIYPWLTRGYVPARRAVQIEALYKIPRNDLMDPALRAVLDDTENESALAGDVLFQARAKPLW